MKCPVCQITVVEKRCRSCGRICPDCKGDGQIVDGNSARFVIRRCKRCKETGLLSASPFGFRATSDGLKPDPETWGIATALAYYAERGGRGHKSLAKLMNERGLTRFGRPWDWREVRDSLRVYRHLRVGGRKGVRQMAREYAAYSEVVS
jgi:hypothetical protein